MKHFLKVVFILSLLLTQTDAYSQDKTRKVCFEFCDGVVNVEFDNSTFIKVPILLTAQAAKDFYVTVNSSKYQPVIDSLLRFKELHGLNDWLYYQLIRKTAEQISHKADNYNRYTLYKWFLMVKSGYDARLALAGDRIIFYILNDEEISDIPFFMVDNKKYMTLNYHDYVRLDLHKDIPVPVNIPVPGADKAFSYKVTKMPDFKPDSYISKLLNFSYHNREYYFEVKLNTDVEAIFTNYPVVDFESYFNIPLTKETYNSLIPLLKKNVSGMSQKKGVDYLMRFTRYAFLYEDDEQNFGKEKRLSPEETLFSKYSDCDDRAALFFCLVKEIYNMPMIVLLYPTHINIAVQFSKPVGTPIVYNGKVYSECEPTPQLEDLRVGQVSAKLKNVPYKVVYQYEPVNQ
ncbi:hypothetical protein [Mucilaginibacter sp. UYCu711]|uniref:hypothetical protein n=1 Tax=Mucilaginibacter sp. UYCu711 TaxID=3156339 RepID=UPI003D1ED973